MKHWKNNLPLLRQHFIEALLRGDIDAGEPICQYMTSLEIPFYRGIRYFVMTWGIKCGTSIALSTINQERLLGIICNASEQDSNIYVISGQNGLCHTLIVLPEDYSCGCQEKVNSLMGLINAQCVSQFSGTLCAGVGNIIEIPDKLPVCCHQSMEAYQTTTTENRLVYFNYLSEEFSRDSKERSKELDLLSAIRKNDEKKIIQSVNDLLYQRWQRRAGPICLWRIDNTYPTAEYGGSIHDYS